MLQHFVWLSLWWVVLGIFFACGSTVENNYTTSHVSFVANPGNAVPRNLVINNNGSSIVILYDGVNNAYLSHNYGQDWTSLTSDMPTTSYLVAGSMSSSGQYIYLAGYAPNTFRSFARVHISTDFGHTWTLSSYRPTMSSFPYSLHTDTTGQYVILSTEAKSVLLSQDYGATFTTIYNSSNVVGEVVVTTNGYIYFCDSQGVHRSTRSSLTFSVKKALTSLCYTLSVSEDGAIVYVSDGWSLHSSFDYGDSWSTLGGVFVSIASSSSVGAVVAMMSTYYPVVSTDFGVTWTVIDPHEAHYFEAMRVTGDGSRVYLITQSVASRDGLYVITATSSSAVSPTASPSPALVPDRTAAATKGDTVDIGVVVGAVVGAVAGLLLIGFSLYMVYWKCVMPYSSVVTTASD